MIQAATVSMQMKIFHTNLHALLVQVSDFYTRRRQQFDRFHISEKEHAKKHDKNVAYKIGSMYTPHTDRESECVRERSGRR